MCKINKSELSAIVEKMSVMASAEVKAVFTLYAKKAEDKYINSVRLTNKNEQAMISFVIPAEGEDKTATSFSVESKRFVDVAASLLTFDKDVDIAVADGAVTLSIENTSLSIPTTNAPDEVKFDKTGAVAATIEGKAFNTVFRKGGFAVDKNSSRPQCKAATLEIELSDEKTVKVSSSDGNIIAFANTNAQQLKVAEGNEAESLKIAIPGEAIEKILKLASGAQAVNLMATQTQLAVMAGGTVYTCGLATQSMDVSKFLQSWNALKLEEGVTVDAESVLNAIKVLSVADPDCKGYSLDANEESFELTTAGGKQKVSLFPIETLEVFENSEMGISKFYLEKIVKNLNKGNITIRTNNSGSVPFVITNGTCKEPDTKAVAYVMKMKLSVAAPKAEEAE